jgi:hypothetical protein
VPIAYCEAANAPDICARNFFIIEVGGEETYLIIQCGSLVRKWISSGVWKTFHSHLIIMKETERDDEESRERVPQILVEDHELHQG